MLPANVIPWGVGGGVRIRGCDFTNYENFLSRSGLSKVYRPAQLIKHAENWSWSLCGQNIKCPEKVFLSDVPWRGPGGGGGGGR